MRREDVVVVQMKEAKAVAGNGPAKLKGVPVLLLTLAPATSLTDAGKFFGLHVKLQVIQLSVNG